MESTKKENILSKIINKIKNIWERIGEVDIPDNNENLTPEEVQEVKRIQETQKEVHEEGFVSKVPVNERKAQETAKQNGGRNKGKPKILGEA